MSKARKKSAMRRLREFLKFRSRFSTLKILLSPKNIKNGEILIYLRFEHVHIRCYSITKKSLNIQYSCKFFNSEIFPRS